MAAPINRAPPKICPITPPVASLEPLDGLLFTCQPEPFSGGFVKNTNAAKRMTQANFQENETVRMEAFSDGVLAINITLLTFELKAPAFKDTYTNTTLLLAMARHWPAYLAFLLSFATIFVIWVNHHRMFNTIRQSDSKFMYLNGLLLLLTSMIPFLNNVMATYISTTAAELATCLAMLLFGAIAGTLYLMWNHATTDYHLLKRPAADVRVHTVKSGLIISMGIYGASAVLALFLPLVSICIGLLMVVYLSRLKYHRDKVV
jgi:uncharacterized membrane protein